MRHMYALVLARLGQPAVPDRTASGMHAAHVKHMTPSSCILITTSTTTHRSLLPGRLLGSNLPVHMVGGKRARL